MLMSAVPLRLTYSHPICTKNRPVANVASLPGSMKAQAGLTYLIMSFPFSSFRLSFISFSSSPSSLLLFPVKRLSHIPVQWLWVAMGVEIWWTVLLFWRFHMNTVFVNDLTAGYYVRCVFLRRLKLFPVRCMDVSLVVLWEHGRNDAGLKKVVTCWTRLSLLE